MSFEQTTNTDLKSAAELHLDTGNTEVSLDLLPAAPTAPKKRSIETVTEEVDGNSATGNTEVSQDVLFAAAAAAAANKRSRATTLEESAVSSAANDSLKDILLKIEEDKKMEEVAVTCATNDRPAVEANAVDYGGDESVNGKDLVNKDDLEHLKKMVKKLKDRVKELDKKEEELVKKEEEMTKKEEELVKKEEEMTKKEEELVNKEEEVNNKEQEVNISVVKFLNVLEEVQEMFPKPDAH